SLDGGTAATWGGGFRVTDLANPATDLAAFDNALYVAAEAGLYAPTADLTANQELTPAFRTQRNAANGRGLVAWYERLFVPMAASLFAYEASGSFQEIGLGALKGNTSEVNGVPTA